MPAEMCYLLQIWYFVQRSVYLGQQVYILLPMSVVSLYTSVKCWIPNLSYKSFAANEGRFCSNSKTH